MGENPLEADMVNNPPHYQLWPGMEVYDVLVKTLTRDELIGWHKGNSLKYRLRAGAKGEIGEQIKKAEWHEDKLRGL